MFAQVMFALIASKTLAPALPSPELLAGRSAVRTCPVLITPQNPPVLNRPFVISVATEITGGDFVDLVDRLSVNLCAFESKKRTGLG